MTQSYKYTLIEKGNSKNKYLNIEFKISYLHLKIKIKELNICCNVSLIYLKYFTPLKNCYLTKAVNKNLLI